ncbi:MAG TPA: hypothetical protein VEI83_02845 [Acidimicrobiales bacterium]|nr:hypothetical protein [Acidimicrobiales bacterium]
MKNDLWIDEASGQRWDLALDLIDDGRGAVLFGGALRFVRHVGWPGADGLIHVGVITPDISAPAHVAQAAVDSARELVTGLIHTDHRLADLIALHGVIWELVGDEGLAVWRIAPIDQDGRILWPFEVHS